MNKVIGLILIASIALTNCNNRQSSDYNEQMKNEFAKLDSILKQYEEPSQIFKKSAETSSIIIGKKGTIITINPNDFITETGEPLGKEIEIELRELTNQGQFLNANVQTISNKRLLVSGGAYFISITSQGKQLKLKQGKDLIIEFPKLANEEMFLFYGQRDSIGQMEWKQANDTLKVSQLNNLADTIIEAFDEIGRGVKIEKNVYSAIKLASLGWINCDRFFEIQNKTDLLITFNPSENISSSNIFLVFKDINSLMQSYYFCSNGKTLNEGFKNVPVGYKVRLIAYSIKNKKIFSYASDLTIIENQTLKIDLKETNDEELKRLFRNE